MSADRPRWLLFAGIALAVVVADQLAKALVVGALQRGQSVVLLGDLLRLTLVHNHGGIFGLFGQSAALLAVASLGVIAFIVYFQAREGMRSAWPMSAALGLLLGGAVGNLIDRLRLGYVVDIVDAGIGGMRWYTFNVADAAISISLVVLIALSVLGSDRLRRRPPSRDPQPSARQ